jgi:hypothetical protein
MINIEQQTEQITNTVISSSNGLDWATIIAIIALCVAFCALFLIITFYLKLKQYANTTEDNYGNKTRNLRDLIVATVVKSARVSNYVTGIYRECFAAYSQRIPQASVKVSTSPLWNEKQKADKPAMKTAQSGIVVNEQVPQVTTTQLKRLYATAYNTNEDTFYKVQEQELDQTIFEITVNSNTPHMGDLTVHRNAYALVGECKDFLDGSCEIEGAGTSLQILEAGKVTLYANGWKVTKKVRIRFN